MIMHSREITAAIFTHKNCQDVNSHSIKKVLTETTAYTTQKHEATQFQ